MYYKVELIKTVTRTVIIKADSDESADDIIFPPRIARVVPDTIDEAISDTTRESAWEYKSHATYADDDTPICNNKELLDYTGCESLDSLDHALFKYTNVGLGIWQDGSDHIIISGCVEDSDSDGPSELLVYPFFASEYCSTLEAVDSATCREWEELHGEEE